MEYGVFSTESHPVKRARTSRAQSSKSTSMGDKNEIAEADKENERYISGGTTIISIVENRAREICIAKLNTESVSQLV